MLRDFLLVAAVLSAFVSFPREASAQVYKCVDAEGVITYSQAPCPDNPETVNVHGISTGTSDDGIDCRHANRFALETARTMRGGMHSSDLFDSYGGLDALSSGSINLINFVYRYQPNENVSVERIAGLAQTMCQSGNLQGVACEDLPIDFTESLGGCGASAEFDVVTTDPATFQAAPPESARNTPAAPARVADPNDARSSECRRDYLEKIDELDAQMRGGYSAEQGERYREQRRRLREQMSRC